MIFTLTITLPPGALADDIAEKMRVLADLFDTGETVDTAMTSASDDENFDPAVTWTIR